jgi:hypothetical protein
MFVAPLFAPVVGLKAGTVIGPELQTPFGPAVGQFIVTAVVPAFPDSDVFEQVKVPLNAVDVPKDMLAHSISLVSLDEAKKFEADGLWVGGQLFVQLLPLLASVHD